MISPDRALRQCWHQLCVAAATNHDEAGVDDRWQDAIVARHAEPQRRYHTAVHVTWVLGHVDDLLHAEPGTDAVDADAVRAAALFHDIVYDPRSTTNEHDSAAIAATALGELGWPPARVRRVVELIEATAGHARPEAADAAVLLDADLAILGAEPAAYQAYVQGVRAEYGHVADDDWRSGRAAVLRSFLGREHIYATATMRAERERRARANLTAELTGLVGPR